VINTSLAATYASANPHGSEPASSAGAAVTGQFSI